MNIAFSNWMRRGFMFLEGAMLQEAARKNPTAITEDFVRRSFVDGLKEARPDMAQFVCAETKTSWSDNPCLFDGSVASGRPKQHDFSIVSSSGDGKQLLVGEAKWLKKHNPKEIAQDIWKLAFSHGVTSQEKSATKTFLLVGGESKVFSSTLQVLRKSSLNFRWSPSGRGSEWPTPKKLNLELSCRKYPLVFNSWKDSVGWGKGHYRTPPRTWTNFNLVCRERWFKTFDAVSWKLVLWELQFRKPCKNVEFDWEVVKDWL